MAEKLSYRVRYSESEDPNTWLKRADIIDWAEGQTLRDVRLLMATQEKYDGSASNISPALYTRVDAKSEFKDAGVEGATLLKWTYDDAVNNSRLVDNSKNDLAIIVFTFPAKPSSQDQEGASSMVSLNKYVEEQRKLQKEQALERDFDRACNDLGVSGTSSIQPKMGSIPRTPGASLRLKTLFSIDVLPGEVRFHGEDDRQTAAFKSMVAISKLKENAKEKEVDNDSMELIHAKVTEAAGVKYARAKGSTSGITKWKSTNGAPMNGFKFPGKIEFQNYNPDYLVYRQLGDAHVAHAVVDAKAKIFDMDDKGKIVSDAGYVARLSARTSMPFFLWRPKLVYMGEVFVGTTEMDDRVIIFPEMNPSTDQASQHRFLRILLYAFKFGTLLPMFGKNDSHGEGEFSLLGQGRTSLVFQINPPKEMHSRKWCVVKYIFDKDHRKLAKNEVDHLKEINSSLDKAKTSEEDRHVFRALNGSSDNNNFTTIYYDKVGTPLKHDAFLDPDILNQALTGLDQIHKAGVIHNDIRIDNMYMVDKQLVFGDFGFSLSSGKETQWPGGSLMTAHIDVREAAMSKKGYIPETCHDLFSIVALCRIATQPNGWAALVRLAYCQAYWESSPRQYGAVVQAFWTWQLCEIAWMKCAVARDTASLRTLLPAALLTITRMSSTTATLDDIDKLAESMKVLTF